MSLATRDSAFAMSRAETREALVHAFDFESLDRLLLQGQYKRNRSYFNNADFGAHGAPGDDELTHDDRSAKPGLAQTVGEIIVVFRLAKAGAEGRPVEEWIEPPHEVGGARGVIDAIELAVRRGKYGIDEYVGRMVSDSALEHAGRLRVPPIRIQRQSMAHEHLGALI